PEDSLRGMRSPRVGRADAPAGGDDNRLNRALLTGTTAAESGHAPSMDGKLVVMDRGFGKRARIKASVGGKVRSSLDPDAFVGTNCDTVLSGGFRANLSGVDNTVAVAIDRVVTGGPADDEIRVVPDEVIDLPGARVVVLG